MAFPNKQITKPLSPQVVTLSDSDEEIFVGPVTDKEKQKAAKLNRRTQVFFPPISWKLRSSNHSVSENKDSCISNQDVIPVKVEGNDCRRVLQERNSPYTSRHDNLKSTPKEQKQVWESGAMSFSSDYAAETCTPEKTTDALTEPDSLECGLSADSLNSLSKDSLDVDCDSLEEAKKTEYSEQEDAMGEELYDVGNYFEANHNGTSQYEQANVDASAGISQKQFTLEEIKELQEQLDKFAIAMGHDKSVASEKHNSSFEIEEMIPENVAPTPTIEDIFSSDKQSLPSPYDLNKQRLSSLYDSNIDFSLERTSYQGNDKLDTLKEVTEPSSTDVESQQSSVRSSSEKEEHHSALLTAPLSPPRSVCDYLPNSTLMFEELERQIEDEETRQSDHQATYTVLSGSESQADCSSNSFQYFPDATYTLHAKPGVEPDVASDSQSSNNSCFQDVPQTSADVSIQSSQANESCPEGVFNDTLEEMEMLLKYGVDYIYGKHGKAIMEKNAPKEEGQARDSEDDLHKSSDSCGTLQPEKSTPGKLREINYEMKVPTPMKRTPSNIQPKVLRNNKPTPMTTATPSKLPSATPVPSPRVTNPRSQIPAVVTPSRSSKWKDPASLKKNTNETPKFKVPSKMPLSANRTPRVPGTAGIVTSSPRSNKLPFLSQIQSPIGAYIHNSPSPVLMKNVKPKTCPSMAHREADRRQRPVWNHVEPRFPKSESLENINPNVGRSLRVVHYTQAPCIKLDDHSSQKSRLPRLGDRFEKLLDSPCPQVIKHEGRVRVNPSSPQYSAAVKAVRSNFNDSVQSETGAGDISVCVSKMVKRTNTLSVDH